MKCEKKTKRFLNIVSYTILLGALLSSGCLSETMSKVGDITKPTSIPLLQEENYYQIDTSDLTVPLTTGIQADNYEFIPDELTDRSPGFEVSSYYMYTEFYEGTESTIDVYVENMGDEPIFIYQFGFLLVEENNLVIQDTGVTLLPGEEKNVGFVSVKIPGDIEELKLQPQMSILAQTSFGKWHDYKTQNFDEISIEISETPAMQTPDYVSNPEKEFTRINEKVDPSDIGVRTMAAASAKKYPGQYNVFQICALFDDTKEEIQYISDPRGKDVWSGPGETLTVDAGDCDDYAILLSSLIEAIGGTSRVYLTDTHAFTAVYIGNETEEIADAIGDYYGPVPIYYTTDQYGSWLLLDPTSSMYAGGLPGETAPTTEGWTFLNASTITIVDIAPQT